MQVISSDGTLLGHVDVPGLEAGGHVRFQLGPMSASTVRLNQAVPVVETVSMRVDYIRDANGLEAQVLNAGDTPVERLRAIRSFREA